MRRHSRGADLTDADEDIGVAVYPRKGCAGGAG